MNPNDRFVIQVRLIDREDTNDDGDPYVYNSAESMSETEAKHREYYDISQSAAWQLSSRLISEWTERNGIDDEREARRG